MSLRVEQRLRKDMDCFYNTMLYFQIIAMAKVKKGKNAIEMEFMAEVKRTGDFTDDWVLGKLMIGIENRLRLFEKHGVDMDAATADQMKDVRYHAASKPEDCRNALREAVGTQKPFIVLEYFGAMPVHVPKMP